MEDFEIMHNESEVLIKQVRKIAVGKQFDLRLKVNSAGMIMMSCKRSPYFLCGNNDAIGCPFRVRYKLHKE
jgi:hypothetical protein